ncbi:acyltransferase family protein [Pseudomonas fulva]|uniref:acyltransferase family protein n=1 Tax=Pseudomonas fulva TaxID=47880 RepID=UPI003D2F2C54
MVAVANTRTRLEGIESLRAYAAVAVIFFHLVGTGGAKLPEVLSFIGTNFGFGVPLFFVVSGFSLSYGYWQKLNDGEAIGNYFKRRFARIAPLFYAVLLFELVLHWVVWGKIYDPSELLVNALFMFNVIPHMTDGIVWASWSIGVEMIFYVLFPLLLMVCRGVVSTVLALGVSTTVATLFTVGLQPFEAHLMSFMHHNFVTNAPYFVWGILAYHVHSKVLNLALEIRRPVCWLLCALALGSILTLYYGTSLYQYFSSRGLRTTWEMLWGVPFATVCVAMALHPSRLLSNPVTRYLGTISFSLYLIHPIIVWGFGQLGVYSWVYALFPGSEVAGYLGSMAVALSAVTATSVFTFYFIEKPGMEWGKRWARRPPSQETW